MDATALPFAPLSPYVGRFAPSPSGPLHFGSLIAALASFLQARAQHGRWLVRIEDIDPPREMAGAASDILHTLEAYGLYWDGPVLYQSQRHERYDEIIEQLYQQGQLYWCHCTRKEISQMGGYYNGRCRSLKLAASGCAARIVQREPIFSFVDELQGVIEVPAALALEDFIVRRRDGLYAYNLAVVVDDMDSGISQVVRGADLLEPTVRQIALYQMLGAAVPSWLHLPLAVEADGHKLSKQNHAPAISHSEIGITLYHALQFLGQQPPAQLIGCSVAEMIAWAIDHWSLAKVPARQKITLDKQTTE